MSGSKGLRDGARPRRTRVKGGGNSGEGRRRREETWRLIIGSRDQRLRCDRGAARAAAALCRGCGASSTTSPQRRLPEAVEAGAKMTR
ncbi:hypothetical protein E2562_012055 [Oryza meyeriana var. granulata]|uniref:Uncharacterized protein n=1 Tax=Oryza meyeriana var. granulata TaxID=110450 RepID=A0A6G1D148_9ORYZ|nr:hypothetical protein E2562_012055 [Oryza meyeriana var. granulata]